MSETLRQAATKALDKHEKLVSKRDKLQERIWQLQDQKRAVAEEVEVAYKELVKARQACREEDHAQKIAAWDSVAAEKVDRWSPRWWSSEGWQSLSSAVFWNDDLSVLIAAFAELEPRDQFVLEQFHGIGVQRITSYPDLGKVLPDLYRWKEGITRSRAKQVLFHAHTELERKVKQFDYPPWCKLPVFEA